MNARAHRAWHLARAALGFARAQERLGYPPTHLWLEPTNGCNLRCIHCPTGTGLKRARGNLDLSLAERVVAQAAPFRPLLYLHLGGESLLHPQLPELIRMADAAGLPTAMFTNATILDRHRAEALIRAGLKWLGFSVDGLERETYERVRQGGRFDKVIGNIFGFLRLRSELGASTPYTYLSVVDLSEETGSAGAESESLANRLRAAGLDHLEVTPPHTWAGLATVTEPGDRPQAPTRCPSVWGGLAVLWDGRAVPCCLDIEGRHPVGDVKTQSLLEVWNGEPLRLLRRAFASGQWDALPPLCRDCHIPRQPSFLGIPRKAWTELKEEVLGL